MHPFYINYISIIIKNNPVIPHPKPVSVSALKFFHITGGEFLYGVTNPFSGNGILLFQKFFCLL